MEKKILNFWLLALMVMLGGMNAWGENAVSFVAKSRSSYADGVFTAASNAGNGYALAIADLTTIEKIDVAEKVTLEFDSNIPGGRFLVGIGDKGVRGENANGSNKSTYNTEGLIMRFGTSDGTYYRVNGGTNNSSAFNVSVHTVFEFDRVNSKYSYTLSNKETGDVLFTAKDVATEVENADIVEVYSWTGGSMQISDVTVALVLPAEPEPAGVETTNVDIDFSNDIVTSDATPKFSIAGTVSSLEWDQQWTEAPSVADGILRVGNFTGKVNLVGAAAGTRDVVTVSFDLGMVGLSNKETFRFYTYDADGTTIAGFGMNKYNGSMSSNDMNITIGDVVSKSAGDPGIVTDTKNSFTIKLDYAQHKIFTTIVNKNGTFNYEADLATDAKPVAAIGVGSNCNNGSRRAYLDNLKVTTTTGDYSVATANYTVKFVCGETEVKEAESRSDVVGASISVTSSDKTNFFANSDQTQRFIYVGDDAEGKTVAEDGSTIITITYREAEKWAYTVNTSVDGTALKHSVTGSVWEDLNTAKIAYPRFQANGTTLVERKPVSNELNITITVANNNFVQDLEYVATDPAIDNLYLLSEAEGLETELAKSSTTFSGRVSGGQIIYGAKGDLMKLPAGKYIFTLGVIGGDNNTHKVNYVVYKEATPTEEGGEHNANNMIAEGTCTGNFLSLFTGAEFELSEETTISFTCSDPASSRGIDLVYIQKTGDVETPVETEDEVVDFDASFYHNWSEVSATATDLGLADGGVVIGEEVALGGTIWGNLTGSVPYLNYANITDYSELRFEGTPGAVLRLMCNRTTDEGPIYEIKPTIGEDGKLTVSISDLKFLNGGTPCDFVCLQSIKVPADWQGGTTAATITSIKIVKPGDPLSIPKTELENAINVAKQQNAVAKSEESFAALTAAIAAAEAALAAADATAESLAAAKAAVEEAVAGLTFADGYSELSKEMFKQYESLENPGEGTDGFGAYELFTASGLPYGDGNVSELKWADLAEYEQLIITTVGEVKPRLCLNRLVAGGQQAATMEESKMLDINPNNEYTWSTEKYLTAENGVYTLNVAAIVADYGFARLHCIKKQGWGAGVVVTGLYLKKAAAPEPQPLTEWDVTYALQEGDTFTSGQTVEVKDDANNLLATITYGETGGADFKAAKADAHVDGYVAFTEGNGTNGNKAGGTFYTIAPVYDGTISVAVVLNADKAFYVMEDGVALADYDGIKVTEKYYGTYTFDVAAGKSYKFYCAGSKLGFYGFNYKNKPAEPEIVSGDVSGDGEVTVSDAVPVVDYVLGAQEPTEAQKKAADVNKDNEITVSDVSGIVSIALGLWDGTIAEAARGMANNDYVVLNGTEVGLVNANQYVGFQMDVTLAEGAQLNGVSRTARTLGHQVAWNRVGRNTYRIVAFSLASESLSHNEGSLLNLDLKGNQQVALSNIEFTDAQARAYALGLAETTGIGSLNVSTADSQTYTLGGARSNQLQKGVNIVRSNDGQVKKVLVK